MPVIDLANPTRFLNVVNRVLPWLAAVMVILFAIGLYRAVNAPDDYQQGATVKIMYLHVPAAWLGMMGWGLMTIAALGTLVWRHPLADVTAKAAAPIGAAFTFLCLVTGSLWGRPTWGTYWVWDARLTSELVLLLLYFGVLALYCHRRGSRPRRPRRRDPGAGRRRQPADHQVLGRLVEHAAPGRVDLPRRRLDHRPVDPVAAADHDRCLHAAVRRAAARRHAQRDPAPARTRDAHDRSAKSCGGNLMDLGPHADFIVAAYAVALFVVAGLIAWVALDYAAQRRILGDLEERGVTRRSARDTR